MDIRYFNEHSNFLNRNMEFKMYGHGGKLCLVIPCQDGRFFEWEDRRMFELVHEWIDQGKVQFVTVDSIDPETWSGYGDSSMRMAQQENWIGYIMEELIPSALEKAGKDPKETILVTGASMGATHAANLFFRFPERFDGILAMSGIYDLAPYIYDGNYDGNFYQNNPLSYLSNMPLDHPYIEKYNQNHGIFVVGSGDWEGECKWNLERLGETLYHKGIQQDIYYWGYDIPHDWCSWEKQLQIYLPQLLEAE